jgi:hypothetical protein
MRRIRSHLTLAKSVPLIGVLVASAIVAPALIARPNGPIVLGSKKFAAPYGRGWGKVEPRTISNGGDLSGQIKKIHWRHWGHRIARGHGRNHTFKPQGGYYRHFVRAELKAKKIGHCRHERHLAYKQLIVRIQKKPGGPFTHWFNWGGRKGICRSPY